MHVTCLPKKIELRTMASSVYLQKFIRRFVRNLQFLFVKKKSESGAIGARLAWLKYYDCGRFW